MRSLSSLLNRKIFNSVRNYAANPSALRNVRAESTTPAGLASFSEKDAEEFMSYFPEVVKDIVEDQETSDIRATMERVREMLHYNVPTGKRVRGLTTVISYKHLEKPDDLTPQNVRLANILGWCAELIEASILVLDDIVDKSDTRRKAPCWYKRDDVGLNAIFDANLLECYAYSLLRKYFSSHPFYPHIVDLFHDTYRKTALGQSMDSIRYTARHISMEQFRAIALYKTGYYTFYFPAVLGMYLSKAYTRDLIRQAEPLLLQMGEFFQIQNDFNDCYGNPDITGKVGTDIEEGKCTWLSVMALRKATPSQLRIMEEHYGSPAEESVRAVRDLYDRLDLPSTYAHFEKQSFEYNCGIIRRLESPQRQMFLYLVEKLYKRKSDDRT